MPLLEAYQGPYRIKYYYWTGMQLVVRVVFYGISSLDRNINLTIGAVLLSILAVLQGWIKPFRLKYKNLHELIFLLNLQLLFIISLSIQSIIVTNTMVAIAAVQFILIVAQHTIIYTCVELTRKGQSIISMLFNQLRVETFDSEETSSHAYVFNELQQPLTGSDDDE